MILVYFLSFPYSIVVQWKRPPLCKYKGPGHALVTMAKEEGLALYAGPHTLVSMAHHTLSAFFLYASQLLIERGFGISPDHVLLNMFARIGNDFNDALIYMTLIFMTLVFMILIFMTLLFL